MFSVHEIKGPMNKYLGHFLTKQGLNASAKRIDQSWSTQSIQFEMGRSIFAICNC